MIYKLLTLVAILLIVIYGYRYYIEENFENGNSGGTNQTGGTSEITPESIARDAVNTQEQINQTLVASNSEGTSNSVGSELPACQPAHWWENQPIKAIRSKLWGASYNLIYKEDGNINTPVLVPIHNPNSQSPPGCLSVTTSGWHESAMCSEKNVDQRWIIKKISNQDDFTKAINDAKQTGDTTGFTYGYKMDKVDYPFFIVVAKDHPSQALYYNGSALGVRPIGNYDDQKWDILKDSIKDPIITHEYNYYSKLTPELQTSRNFQEGSLAAAQVPGFQALNNPQALTTLLNQILKQPNAGGAIGIGSDSLKINIEMDDAVLKELGGTSVSTSNSSNSTVVEAFTNPSVQYPKKPIDINVTLNYAIARADQTVDNSSKPTIQPSTITLPQYELGPNGELIKIGEETVANPNLGNNSNDKSKSQQCNDTLCYPNMNDWLPGPYPCSGCVSRGDDWSP